MRYHVIAAAVLFSALLMPQGARAAELTSYEGVAISPDGRYVADVESVQSPDVLREVPQQLFVRDVKSKVAREIALPCGGKEGCAVTVPVWSGDSKTIAYVVHGSGEKTRSVFTAAVSANAIVTKQLLTYTGTLDSLRFSHDMTDLAMLAIPNARKEVGATQAGAAIVGEIGADFDEQRIAVVPIAKPVVRYASPANLFVYEYDWTSDDKGFVGTAAPGDGDNNWWVARLYRFDAASTVATEIYRPSSPQQQIASPRVSGNTVAFVGGIMSDFGSTGGDLYALDLAKPGVAVDLTPGTAASVTSLTWLCNLGVLLTTQLHGDRLEISLVDPSFPNASSLIRSENASFSSGSGAAVSPTCPTRGDIFTPSPNRSDDPYLGLSYATTRQTFEAPPEIAIGDSRSPLRALTNANASIPAEASARSISWHDDAFDVQGWLLEPKRARASGAKRPMIVSVHGGPAAASTPRFIGRGTTRDLLRAGYAVFLPNPRGSFGQGEAFAAANVKDFGYGDLRDILAGVDAAERADPSIDDARLGITGGSYGGFMTMWAVTQTNRFKAAVAGAGIANWISYYGENGIDEWMIPYFGASAYDDPATYRKSSPIDFINNVKTPTFAYVGERDVECPAPQSQEFWHALVARDVKTSLVIYAGEGHRIRAPKNQADVTRRTLAWFAGYLTP